MKNDFKEFMINERTQEANFEANEDYKTILLEIQLKENEMEIFNESI